MQFTPTAIPDVILIEPKVYKDERGFFMETYQAGEFARAGIPPNFVQDNHSGTRQGILRGLHYQIRQPQGKLVRVVTGEVFDVAVDLRRSSATFRCWVGVQLSSENRRQVYVPPGIAHGIYVLSEWAEIVYKASDYYAPQWETTLIWNDPTIGIDWPLIAGQPPLLSSKDARGIPFKESELFD